MQIEVAVMGLGVCSVPFLLRKNLRRLLSFAFVSFLPICRPVFQKDMSRAEGSGVACICLMFFEFELWRFL
jgi:hypothetical protein